ncbi:hypothetical protein RintRC_6666 [Richelia intracellularis]|nr:hypothetical protein RintRC_6666 [Richelia intracellularis]
MLQTTTNHKNHKFYDYVEPIINNPILYYWGWAIPFLVISIFNGWILYISSADLPLTIFFAIFPLAPSVYIFSINTKVIAISLIISQIILAFAICNLEPSNSIVTWSFYGINLVLFISILTKVAKENGVVIPVLITFSIMVLLLTFGWEWIGKVVWYCNLTFTANKAGKKIIKFVDNLDSTMLILCGIAALGLTLGWKFAHLSASGNF